MKKASDKITLVDLNGLDVTGATGKKGGDKVTWVDSNGNYVDASEIGGGGGAETDPVWNAEKSQYAKLTDIPGETDPVWNAEKDNYVLKSEVGALAGITRVVDYGVDETLADAGASTPKDILITYAPKTGNYRFFLSGQIIRTGGNAAIGKLELQLKINGVIKGGGVFEVFRDMAALKTLVSINSFDITQFDDIVLHAIYTPAGAETVSVNGLTVGADII